MLGGHAEIRSFNVVCAKTLSALLNWFRCGFVALCKLGILCDLNRRGNEQVNLFFDKELNS